MATSQASLSLCLADLGALPEALAAANKAVATCEAFKRPAVGLEDDYLYSAQARLVLGRVLLARGEEGALAALLGSCRPQRGV